MMSPGPWWIKAAVAAVPATILVTCGCVLMLVGLACDEKRRKYVATLCDKAFSAAVSLFNGPGGDR
jgi:hypothetical protein